MMHHQAVQPLLHALGFSPDSRVAIFHADDVGMCHGANVAFEELSRKGSINCGSVMVPCPWFTEVVEMAAADARLDVGVHLTLTSERTTYRWPPISTTSRSSGLIDESGYFWRRLPMLGAHVVPQAAEAEMRAQIERALAAGIDITHLDTHMGASGWAGSTDCPSSSHDNFRTTRPFWSSPEFHWKGTMCSCGSWRQRDGLWLIISA
jgi:YdjC-like protein